MCPHLLDDEPLTGTIGVRRWLTPERDAHLVDADNLTDAIGAVEAVCNIWGGAYHLLIPIVEGAPDLPEPWRTLMQETRPTRTAVRGRLPMPAPGTHPEVGGVWVPNSGGEMPLAVLGRTEVPPGGFRTARIANGMNLSDPWTVAYNAVWGRLPATIDPQELTFARLREGATYTDVLTVDGAAPQTPGAADLLASLRDPSMVTGAALSCARLAFSRAPVGSQFERQEPPFPVRFHTARECGPNLVVVYEPGSVADLCLLWHLRALHGLRSGLPLGVPVTEDVPAALKYWWSELAMLPWGLRQTRAYLVSMSVDSDSLTDIATASGTQWDVVSCDAVLQPSAGCGIASSEVAVFTSGVAQLSVVHPAETAALGDEVIAEVARSLQLIATPSGHTLPPSETLASDERLRCNRGGVVIPYGGHRDTSAILHWPTGQTVLEAVVRDVGLRAEPSGPGRLAATLLQRCSGLGIGIGPLLHPIVQELLSRLGSRHGMNWFKRRLRNLVDVDTEVAESVEERLLLIEQRVAAMAGEPSVEEQTDISFGEVQAQLHDRRATQAWLAWSEQAGLLLRGAQVQCSHCMGRSWRPLADLVPPVVCGGCGLAIEQPYPYDHVQFRYRATELLLRLTKDDAIVHALAIHFFDQLFRVSSGEVGLIFGGYPGVTLRRPGGSDPVGEADVMFVMIDGRVGVGECKTAARGLTEVELDKLARIADASSASWTFTATLDRASACGPLWRTNPTAGRLPHYALTAEHLYDPFPINTLGTDPLAWRTSYLAVGAKTEISDEQHLSTLLRCFATGRGGNVPALARRGD